MKIRTVEGIRTQKLFFVEFVVRSTSIPGVVALVAPVDPVTLPDGAEVVTTIKLRC